MDEKVPAPSVVGDYTLRGCADYQGSVVESNEANNCLETPFEIKAGQPDFIIIATGLTEGTSIKSGTRAHPYCIVQNIGTGNSPREMRLAYYINQDTYRDDDNVSANEMCIGCQQKEEVNNNDIKLGDRGTRTLRCCADYQGVVAESNESNNCLTVEFQVTKK